MAAIARQSWVRGCARNGNEGPDRHRERYRTRAAGKLPSARAYGNPNLRDARQVLAAIGAAVAAWLVLVGTKRPEPLLLQSTAIMRSSWLGRPGPDYFRVALVEALRSRANVARNGRVMFVRSGGFDPCGTSPQIRPWIVATAHRPVVLGVLLVSRAGRPSHTVLRRLLRDHSDIECELPSK